MNKDLTRQLIDLPWLMSLFGSARGTGDILRERPHRRKRSIGADKGDVILNKGVSRRHQGKGTSHTGAEQPASRLVHIRLFNEPAVYTGQSLYFVRIKAEIAHRRRPV